MGGACAGLQRRKRDFHAEAIGQQGLARGLGRIVHWTRGYGGRIWRRPIASWMRNLVGSLRGLGIPFQAESQRGDRSEFIEIYRVRGRPVPA